MLRMRTYAHQKVKEDKMTEELRMEIDEANFELILKTKQRHIPLKDTSAFEDGAKWAKDNIFKHALSLALAENKRLEDIIKRANDKSDEAFEAYAKENIPVPGFIIEIKSILSEAEGGK